MKETVTAVSASRALSISKRFCRFSAATYTCFVCVICVACGVSFINNGADKGSIGFGATTEVEANTGSRGIGGCSGWAFQGCGTELVE